MAREATQCPYCGVQMSAEGESSLREPEPDFHEDPLCASPQRAAPYARPEAPEPLSEGGGSGVLLSMGLLLPGVAFLLFGMALALFATGDRLTLSWNAHYWWVFFFGAFPLLYYGWMALNELDERD